MTIDDAIAQLLEFRKHYGNLELFDSEHYKIDTFIIIDSDEENFPKDWEMPEQFVSVPYNG